MTTALTEATLSHIVESCRHTAYHLTRGMTFKADPTADLLRKAADAIEVLSRRPSPAGDDVERVARAIFEGGDNDPVLDHLPDVTKEPFRRKARAALSALHPRVVEGWKLVPEEPTKEMLDAATASISRSGSPDEDYTEDMRFAYHAMLSTSPPPPAPAPRVLEGFELAPKGWREVVGDAAYGLACTADCDTLGVSAEEALRLLRDKYFDPLHALECSPPPPAPVGGVHLVIGPFMLDDGNSDPLCDLYEQDDADSLMGARLVARDVPKVWAERIVQAIAIATHAPAGEVAPVKWRDIEAVPKDGTPVLICIASSPAYYPSKVQWHPPGNSEGRWLYDCMKHGPAMQLPYTHFMHLPEPPASPSSPSEGEER